MNQTLVKDQVSLTIDHDEISSTSNEISSASNEIDSHPDRFEFFVKNGLTNIHEYSLEYSVIKTSFFSSMGQNSELVKKTKIVAIHKNLNSSGSGKARAQNFHIFSKAVADKCGGNANVKYAWYGASRDEICEIAMDGFNWCLKVAGNRDCCRHSISLSPAKFSFDR